MTTETGHIWLGNISEGEQIRGCYLVKEKRVGTTRTGNPFLSLILADRSGDMEAKVWDRAGEYSLLFQQGDIVEVAGVTESFRGQVQANVRQVRLPDRPMDPRLFMESAPGEVSEMIGDLKSILNTVEDRHLKTLCDRFLADRKFMEMFRKAPAAKNFHHCYLGGLLEHTLSVCVMAERVLEHYARLDRDLLLSGAFLHDIGKVREFSWDGLIAYTDEGRLLGHVAIGAAMADSKIIGIKGFPEALAFRLKHLILSHHGQYDFGSPKRPKFLEAFALHLIDDLDAKMNGLSRIMDKDLREGAWTDYNRMFERYLLKGGIGSNEDAPETDAKEPEAQATLFTPEPG